MISERKTIKDLYPKILQYFVNPKIAEYSINVKIKADVICPCCGKIHSVPVRTIAARGNTYCPKCCDTYSYPERFMSAVLDALKVDYIPQFHAQWTKLYRYDFKFEYNGNKYLLEMDGELGHGHKKGGKSQSESIAIDEEKNLLAVQHGYKIIRIDCAYGNRNRFKMVRDNILSSELSQLFDLSKIDWDECNKAAASSKRLKVLEIYENITPYIDEIAEMLHLPSRTVKAILTEARKDELILKQPLLQSNPLKDCPVKVIMDTKYQITKTCPVYCYEDAIAFGSTYDADEYYGYPKHTVRNSLCYYNGAHKGRHFIKYNNLPKDFDFKPVFFADNEYRCHAYCQWTMDDRLVSIYESKQALPSNYKYLAIQRVVNGMYKSAYGYKWTILPKDIEFQWLKIPIEERSVEQIELLLKKRGCV